MTEPLPCPFCGQDPGEPVDVSRVGRHPEYRVQCVCGAAHMQCYGTRELAIARWNTRPGEAAARADMRERCAKACFDPSTLCAAPLHCGCREKIVVVIRALEDEA